MIPRMIAEFAAGLWIGLFLSRFGVLEIRDRLLERGDAVLAAAAAWIWPARARANANTWRAQPYDEVSTQENHDQER